MRNQPVERLVELVAINRALASATDHRALFRLVVERTAEFLDADAAMLLLADERGRATIPASLGIAADKLRAFDEPFDESLGRKICRLIDCTPERFLASPVIDAGVVRGFLAIFRRQAPSGESEGALLAALADQVAIAVGNVMHTHRLEKALAALRDADRRKDEFLGMLSHELRNPLAPIRTSIFLLNRSAPGSESAAYARQVIERQTEHLTRLIDDLLDMTRIARGKVTVERQQVDVSQVVRRASDDHRAMLAERSLQLSVDIPSEEIWVVGDATRIAQVIANLLDNAAKFTPPNGKVSVSLRATDSTVEIRVRDTGAGIEAQLLEQVFEPFVQSDQTLARTRGGLGLGLALVKAIVQLHGGTVSVSSAGPGQGSEFVVGLPRIAAQAAVAMPTAATRPQENPKRVLVVDDNRDAAQSLAQLVALFGHTPLIAYDGPSAVDIVKKGAPDVVVCDIGLPDMSGYEVAKVLRAESARKMRLIALSGYAQPEDIRRAIEAGFDIHLAKPADPGEINRLLG